MAYNTRRSGGEAISNVGARRNPPIGSAMSNNFVPGGQPWPLHRPRFQGLRHQGFNNQPNGHWRPQAPHARALGPQQRRSAGPGGPGPKPRFQQQQQQTAPQQQQQQTAPQQQQQQTAPQQQTQPTTQQQPPTPVQQPPPLQQQPPPLQQQPPPLQQQPPPQQQPPSQITKEELNSEEAMECGVETEEQVRRKPFWANKGKITRKERQRRRNVRLSRMLQPKNAVMILNELVKSATYTVTDLPQPSEMNQYTAQVLVDGITHIGHGRTKMEAKNQAAEAALKYIVKNRQFSALQKVDQDGDDTMTAAEDGGPTMPWQHMASFALYKLLNAWGEDPNQARGLQDGNPALPTHNKPAKKMPDNATHMNPLMLLNQMLPQAQFEELERSGNPPDVVFTFRCTVDEQTFLGTGPNKKTAKKMTAYAVCTKILNLEYPPELYTPVSLE